VDIVIEKAVLHAPFMVVSRKVDGQTWVERAPKETLAIRAAEYDLDPEDDFVLDLVMLEPFLITTEKPGEVHPLFFCDSVADALEVMHARVAEAQDFHGAPKGKNRALAAAVRNGVASAGLVMAHDRYRKYADPRVTVPVQRLRDVQREQLRNRPKEPTMADRLMAEVEKIVQK